MSDPTARAGTAPASTPAAHPGRRRLPLRRLLQVAALLLVGLLFAGVGFELLLRVLDPLHYAVVDQQSAFMRDICLPDAPDDRPQLTAHYLRPGATSELFGAPVEINALGYRGPVYPQQKPAGTWRIVVVGDSVPFGWGIAETDCFPRVLERRLNELDRPFDAERVEVVNLSGPGRGLGDYILMLEDEGLSYDPDLVIVPFVVNDVPLDMLDRGDETPPAAWRLPATLHASWALRFAVALLNSARGTQQKAEYWAGVKTDEQASQLCCFGFQLLQQKAGSVPLVILDTVGDRPGEGIEQIANCTAAMGLPRIEAYLDIDHIDDWGVNPPVDPHPDAEAHAWYADLILAWLRSTGRLR